MKPSKEAQPFHDAAKKLVERFRVGYQKQLSDAASPKEGRERAARK